MRQWINKLMIQLNHEPSGETTQEPHISEDRATLLFLIDLYNKHLLDIDSQPVRKVRTILDEFAKELVEPENENADKILFRVRQFFSHYRVDEYSYIRKTFEDFKSIIWDFVDQLSEDMKDSKNDDADLKKNLDELREAVEADSIDLLRAKSREFIDAYIEKQTRRDQHQQQKVDRFKKNLSLVKKELVQAHEVSFKDHLTGAYNRRFFEEQAKKLTTLATLSQKPLSMLMVDIDHFKKVNDTYGHDVGDEVIRECVRTISEVSNHGVVCRLGGEEFVVIYPDYDLGATAIRAEEICQKIRKQVLVQDDMQIKFTVSIGVAEWKSGEHVSDWLKRVDVALYDSKQNGRNRVTLSGQLKAAV